MSINRTRYRCVQSKDLERILLWIDSLPYKIEIKGNPIFVEGIYKQFYILPESENAIQVFIVNLD